MIVPMWLAKGIAWCGVLLMVFALLDGGLALFGTYITGEKWSSIALFVGGLVLRVFGAAIDEE